MTKITLDVLQPELQKASLTIPGRIQKSRATVTEVLSRRWHLCRYLVHRLANCAAALNFVYLYCQF